jgi:hypothetical protein
MKIFTSPSRNTSLYYITYQNIAYCEFEEAYNFLATIFQTSFPHENLWSTNILITTGDVNLKVDVLMT